MNLRTVRLFFAFVAVLCLLAGCRQEEQVQEYTVPETTAPAQPFYGWVTEQGQRRYLLPDGAFVSGWLSLEDGKYYLDENGYAVSGQVTVDGSGYFFDNDGRMVTGIVILDEIGYLYGEDGVLAASGWKTYLGNTYYIVEEGKIYTGWLQLEGGSYYLKSDGTMAVGRTQVGEEVFYFTPDGIQVTLVNPWHTLDQDYEVELVKVLGHQVDVRCAEALELMLKDCEKAGNQPRICSAYRTYEKQETLYKRKVQSLMAQGHKEEEAKKLAGTEVAVPGTSEHQLGLAVDIVDASNWNLNETQAKTPSQLWLMEHCWEYGFILRYPNEKSVITGIIYEPWHYRYVGVEIAMALKDSGLCLEEYLDAVVE